MNESQQSDVSKVVQVALGLAGSAALVAAAMTVFLGNAFVFLITLYAIAFGMAIITLHNDGFSNAVRLTVISFAAAIIFLCTLSPLPNSAIQGLPLTDRLNYYYIYYLGRDLGGVQDTIEGGFLAIVTIARRIMPFEVFLSITAVAVLASLLALARAAGQNRIMALLALTMLSYFTFWSGALNVTRQFAAGGVALWSAVILIAPSRFTTFWRVAISCGIVALAINIHSSAVVFVVFSVLYSFRRYGNRLISVIWGGNLIIFALNYAGFSVLSLVPGVSARLARYDTSQISDAGLAQFQSAGVTGGNRLDWMIALALPMLLYRILIWSRVSANSDRETNSGTFLLTLLYTTLCVPFFLLSFLTFGDRLAFYSFMVLPVLVLSMLVEVRRLELCYAALVALAFGCLAQMAFGLYGYTPKLWLSGIS